MVAWRDIQGILFDLDGVIADTAKLHAQAWQEIANQVATPWTPALQAQLKGLDRMHSLAVILAASTQPRAYPLQERQALAAAKNAEYLRLITTLTPADTLPGICAFLQSLKQQGYRLALASASKNAPAVLARLGLEDYFAAIVDPDRVKAGKPAPDIYLQAAAAIGLTPAACLGIEDAASGVAAINAAGATAIGIGDASELAAAAVVFAETSALTIANLQTALADK